MYFSRITIQPRADINQFASEICQNSYKEHQTLWNLFEIDPNANRDFIYRYEMRQGKPSYYIVSERPPTNGHGIWMIETKEYDPKISTGQKFSFVLRANPVVTKNGKKHDVVMAEKHRIDYKNIPVSTRPPLQQIVQQAGEKWLIQRADDNGFSIEEEFVSVDRYQLHESFKPKSKHSIRFSTIDYQGVLKVSNIDKFQKTLLNGLGKSKAFGCGLLLVKHL